MKGYFGLYNPIGDPSPLTTKGDIFTYSTEDTRLPVGTNGQVLIADSTQTSGLRWGTLAGSGDVIGPASNTDGNIPQWDGADSKTLKNGLGFSISGTLAENSDSYISSQKAVKTYVDTEISSKGLPSGGTTGQILTKQSGSDYDTGWEDQQESIDLGKTYALINSTIFV